MITKKTLTLFNNFLIEYAEGEKQQEVLRQILCEQQLFEPYAAFQRIDREKNGSINANQIRAFLSSNGKECTQNEVLDVIRQYDSDGDKRLIYSEFLRLVLTVDNPVLRSVTSQKQTYEVRKDAFLNYDIEFALTRLIFNEIWLQKKLNSLRIILCQYNDFDVKNLFREIDTTFSGMITFDTLKLFVMKNGLQMGDLAILSLLRRFDQHDNGLIDLNEFVFQIYPSEYQNQLPMQLLKRNFHAHSFVNYLKPKFQSVVESQLEIINYEKQKQPKINNYLTENPFAKASQALTKSHRKFKNKQLYDDNSTTPTKITKKRKISRSNKKKSKLSHVYPTKTRKLKQKSVVQRRRSTYKKQTKLEIEFITVLKSIVALERELEIARQDLALRPDFNLLDMFRWLDQMGKGLITSLELRRFLIKQGFTPRKEELYLLMKKYDYDSDGKWKYSDFAESFSPRAVEYLKMLEARESINASLEYELDEVFTDETIQCFINLLTLEIENEVAVEALRQRLYKRKDFNLFNLFKYVDRNQDGYITRREVTIFFVIYKIPQVKYYLEVNDYFISQRELEFIFERFDKNRNNKISYTEFMQELSPKSHRKFC